MGLAFSVAITEVLDNSGLGVENLKSLLHPVDDFHEIAFMARAHIYIYILLTKTPIAENSVN